MYHPEIKEITTIDNHSLTCRIFTPEHNTQGAVLIVPAIGTQQEYYTAFANWLAHNGYIAVTFDYRGIGLSRHGSLRGFKADIMDWATIDCAAMIDTIASLAPGKPLYWVGHSFGGQILGFVPNANILEKAIFIAAGSGYWRENSPALKWRVWWLWYVVAPVAIMLFGYFPGKKLRKVGDLPKGVMLQWRSWCLNPQYSIGVEGESARHLFSTMQTPIYSLSFSDDEFTSAHNVQALLDTYSSAKKTDVRLKPQDINVKRIGHFGFFRKKFATTLWHNYILTEINK